MPGFLLILLWLVVLGIMLSYARSSSRSGKGQDPRQQLSRRKATSGFQVGPYDIWGGMIFGRWYQTGKLVEPEDLNGLPWPDPDPDPITESLRRWRATPYAPPKPEWPTWQPLWPQIRLTERPISESALTSLWVPVSADPPGPPYDRLHQTARFPDSPKPPPVPATPPYPELLPVEYPKPELYLPFWGPDERFPLLNRFVEAAHAKLVLRYEAALRRHAQRENDTARFNQARKDGWGEASARREAAIAEAQRKHTVLVLGWIEAKRRFEEARDADLLPLRAVKSLLDVQDPQAIRQHFELALRWRPLPPFVPTDRTITFEHETGVLLVEQRFPETARVEIVTLGSRPVPKSKRKQWIAMLHPSLLLRIARTLAEADTMNVVEAVAVNAWIDFHDRATGHPRRAYCACVVARKTVLLALNFESLDPVECLRRLSGRDAGETYETVPVAPILRMNEDDPRFVESKEVLGRLHDGQNLAAMPWEDFEHFVRELFERVFADEGATVKITRASRDHGVDAVLFNPDPIKGGKTVIQAKRYTNPVELSAVRDLYGAVTAERANTGILVTTSHFGADAYVFAQDKNLSLIDGPMLLGLLEKHGLRFRIDLGEAKALAERPSS